MFDKLKSSFGKKQEHKSADVNIPTHDSPSELLPAVDDGISIHPTAAKILEAMPIVLCRQFKSKSAAYGGSGNDPIRFALRDAAGDELGYIEEEVQDSGFKRALQGTARKFACHLLDLQGNRILSIQRPLTIAEIRGKVSIYTYASPDSEGELVGQVYEKLSLAKTKYELRLQRQNKLEAFAHVTGRYTGKSMHMVSLTGEFLGSIDRPQRGVWKDYYTDVGLYVLRDASHQKSVGAPAQMLSISEQTEAQVAANAVSETAGQQPIEGLRRLMSPAERAVMLVAVFAIDLTLARNRQANVAALA
jgi:hypothetical protein